MGLSNLAKRVSKYSNDAGAAAHAFSNDDIKRRDQLEAKVKNSKAEYKRARHATLRHDVGWN